MTASATVYITVWVITVFLYSWVRGGTVGVCAGCRQFQHWLFWLRPRLEQPSLLLVPIQSWCERMLSEKEENTDLFTSCLQQGRNMYAFKLLPWNSVGVERVAHPKLQLGNAPSFFSAVVWSGHVRGSLVGGAVYFLNQYATNHQPR